MAQEYLSENDIPVPLINPDRCTGCGVCVLVCPTGTLEMRGALAVVAHPDACAYHGYCEQVCPVQAITRPFEITDSSEKG